MKERNVIVMDRMGCTIREEERPSYIDLLNHRYYLRGICIENKGILFEITKGYQWRFTTKNGKKLKKAIREHNNKLWFHSYWRDENGSCWGLIKIDESLNSLDCLYTKADLLRAINSKNKYKIDDILIFDNIFSKIRDNSGYREDEVLDHCIRITETLKTEEHHCLTFYSKDNSFVYDIISGKIVG